MKFGLYPSCQNYLPKSYHGFLISESFANRVNHNQIAIKFFTTKIVKLVILRRVQLHELIKLRQSPLQEYSGVVAHPFSYLLFICIFFLKFLKIIRPPTNWLQSRISGRSGKIPYFWLDWSIDSFRQKLANILFDFIWQIAWREIK